MADFLTKLASRTLGLAPLAQPAPAPMFAPWPAAADCMGEDLAYVDAPAGPTPATDDGPARPPSAAPRHAPDPLGAPGHDLQSDPVMVRSASAAQVPGPRVPPPEDPGSAHPAAVRVRSAAARPMPDPFADQLPPPDPAPVPVPPVRVQPAARSQVPDAPGDPRGNPDPAPSVSPPVPPPARHQVSDPFAHPREDSQPGASAAPRAVGTERADSQRSAPGPQVPVVGEPPRLRLPAAAPRPPEAAPRQDRSARDLIAEGTQPPAGAPERSGPGLESDSSGPSEEPVGPPHPRSLAPSEPHPRSGDAARVQPPPESGNRPATAGSTRSQPSAPPGHDQARAEPAPPLGLSIAAGAPRVGPPPSPPAAEQSDAPPAARVSASRPGPAATRPPPFPTQSAARAPLGRAVPDPVIATAGARPDRPGALAAPLLPEPSPPAIVISIGRVVVRAVNPPAPAARPRPAAPAAPRLSLADYLRNPNGERR